MLLKSRKDTLVTPLKLSLLLERVRDLSRRYLNEGSIFDTAYVDYTLDFGMQLMFSKNPPGMFRVFSDTFKLLFQFLV